MQIWPEKRENRLNVALGYAAVFVVAAAAYGYVQFQPAFSDPDSFYHVKMAMLMAERGVIRDFTWLPFTTLSRAYADHHFLYHLLLIPFIAAFGPLIGMKVATVTLAAAAITAFYGVLRTHGVRWPAAFAFILGTSGSFIFRLNLAKAPAMSLMMLMLALIAIKKEKPFLLFLLAWAYVWSYGGWPIMAVVVAVFLASRAAVDRLVDRHPHWSWAGRWFWKRMFRGSRQAWGEFFEAREVRHALAAAAGLVSGLVVNPYFPKNLSFYWEQIVQIAVINYQEKIGVGSEWYPYPLADMFGESGAVFLAFFLGVLLLVAMALWNDLVRRGLGGIKRDKLIPIFASLFLAGFFFLLALRSRRHIEYFAPFMTLTTALLFTMLVDRLDVRSLVAKIRWIFTSPSSAPKYFAAYWIILFAFLGIRDVMLTRSTYDKGIPWTKYERAAAWLSGHTPADSIVVHSDWDDFPMLFFHDHRNRYIVGLDPTFMYREDPVRYRSWVDLTVGNTKEGIHQVVTGTLGSRFVLVENDHEAMLKAVENDPMFRLVYKDKEVRIFSAL